MKKEVLKNIINKIKKYSLTDAFKTSKDFDNWLSKLNKKQIKNFLSLNIEPDDIKFPKKLLIDHNLLNCDDYLNRVKVMMNLKNGEGSWHLFDRLCSKNFLNSPKYYEDINLISKADTARYALWIINDDNFINSKYHEEDLNLIVNAKDNLEDEERKSDWLVAEALASVAGNIDSINSPYHRQDMDLIYKSSSKCLQMSHTYPERGLNKLAINKVSLNDKYHLENMLILSKNPTSKQFLYNLMTNQDIINGKYYREEIEILATAKSHLTAIAMYYYITNPPRNKVNAFSSELYNFDDLSIEDIWLLNGKKSVKGNLNPNYLKNLKLLNDIEDKYVMHFESLLSNEYLLNSNYQEQDINLLLTIKDKDIFMHLYQLMTNEKSLSSKHHKTDVKIISKVTDAKKRGLLLLIATNEYNLNSPNHDFDMHYITMLNLDDFNKENINTLYYYLFNKVGVNDKSHIESLIKLSKGEKVEKPNEVTTYIDELEEQLNNNQSNITIKPKFLSKIKKRLINKKDC